MYFTRFASFHRNGALKSRGLQTHACTDGESKRLHIFTSASSFKWSPAFLNSHFVRATRITNTVVKQNHIRCWLYPIPTQTVQHFIIGLSEQQSFTTTIASLLQPGAHCRFQTSVEIIIWLLCSRPLLPLECMVEWVHTKTLSCTHQNLAQTPVKSWWLPLKRSPSPTLPPQQPGW